MSQIKFNTAVESKAIDKAKVPEKDGQFIIVTDTRKLMYDDGNNRITLGDVVELDTDAQRTEILAPLNKFYFIKETGVLWRYNTNAWIKFIDNSNIGEYIDNTKSKAISCTLLANKWENGRNNVPVHGLQENTNGIIGLAQGIGVDEYRSACAAEMYVCEQSNGILTVVANGEIPACDIPSVIILFN